MKSRIKINKMLPRAARHVVRIQKCSIGILSSELNVSAITSLEIINQLKQLGIIEGNNGNYGVLINNIDGLCLILDNHDVHDVHLIAENKPYAPVIMLENLRFRSLIFHVIFYFPILILVWIVLVFLPIFLLELILDYFYLDLHSNMWYRLTVLIISMSLVTYILIKIYRKWKKTPDSIYWDGSGFLLMRDGSYWAPSSGEVDSLSIIGTKGKHPLWLSLSVKHPLLCSRIEELKNRHFKNVGI